MPNISPGLNDRFANIEIGKAHHLPQKLARFPKKAYPSSLYPQNHAASTPSRGPVLSTAKRAESRTLLASRSQISTPVAQKRQLHRTPNENAPNPDSLAPEAIRGRIPDFSQCSFMQQTSSSRKKQSGPDRNVRSVSHSDIYTKRHLAARKRQFSKGNHPADITNRPDIAGRHFEQEIKVPFGDTPTLFSNVSPSRHVSTAYTSRAKEDVYTRLYNSSVKQKVKLDKTRTTKHKPVSHIPKSASSMSLSTLAQGSSKLQSVADMYKLVYTKDSLLFSESNSLCMDMSPNSPVNAHDTVIQNLSIYERGEVMRKQNLYYVPNRITAFELDNSHKNNYGFDDADGNYVIKLNDQIEYRYEILRVLGTGSFGNVVLCADHKYSNSSVKRHVAIKIIKNELDWSLQAVSEIKMLKQLAQPGFNKYLLNYCDHFHFRGHMCIVTEVLSLNLYTFLELGNLTGVSMKLLKSFASKILCGLKFIHDKSIIHCDIKPENIMIGLPSDYDPAIPENASDFQVRIIDFGSSCLESETSYSYIQSRFYRAPEVILGAKYTGKIDMWSFGCVIAELFTGSPLLPGRTELEQIGLVLELFGAPASSYIVGERKKLMQLIKFNGRSLDPLVADPAFGGQARIPVDERKIKKTLLYSLFNIEGKVNLQFLNLQLQSSGGKAPTTPSPFKRSIRPSSKSLEVALRLHGSGESRQDTANFLKFMSGIFAWDPRARSSLAELLASEFLSGVEME